METVQIRVSQLLLQNELSVCNQPFKLEFFRQINEQTVQMAAENVSLENQTVQQKVQKAAEEWQREQLLLGGKKTREEQVRELAEIEVDIEVLKARGKERRLEFELCARTVIETAEMIQRVLEAERE